MIFDRVEQVDRRGGGGGGGRVEGNFFDRGQIVALVEIVDPSDGHGEQFR